MTSSQSKRELTVGYFREWTAGERDECPIRVVVYTENGTAITGVASHMSGAEHSVGAVNVILDKSRG